MSTAAPSPAQLVAAFEALVKLLDSPDPKVQIRAAELILNRGGPR